VKADLRDRLRPALADERTDVAIGDTGTVADDHDTISLAPPIMKFNVKVASPWYLNRRSFLAKTGSFPLFLGLSRQDRDFDVVVRGGSVLDGSGGPAVRKDVGIRGDVVAAVSDLTGATARRVLDAEGLTVSRRSNLDLGARHRRAVPAYSSSVVFSSLLALTAGIARTSPVAPGRPRPRRCCPGSPRRGTRRRCRWAIRNRV